jgi:hypothetical protein
MPPNNVGFDKAQSTDYAEKVRRGGGYLSRDDEDIESFCDLTLLVYI